MVLVLPILRLIHKKDDITVPAVEGSIVVFVDRNHFKLLDSPYFDSWLSSVSNVLECWISHGWCLLLKTTGKLNTACSLSRIFSRKPDEKGSFPYGTHSKSEAYTLDSQCTNSLTAMETNWQSIRFT
eukprot:gb/GECG01007464.1/.p1 GENE.gb/GECG01007464.1/~~gb/GECG01007464.1/.p1  ORF type:complete len:127 (+),score=5.88 gb/GECG01007464.1/:1-381(+)